MADFRVQMRMPGVRVNQTSGSIDINSNGVYDVSDYAEANVNVPAEIPDGSVTMEKLAPGVRANVAKIPELGESVSDLEESAADLWMVVQGLNTSKQDKLIFDNVPNRYSDNPVKSSGIYNALSGKQDLLAFDTEPTGWSNNPVTSHGIYSALFNKQDRLTFDNTPTSGSNNPVTSDGIKGAIETAQSAVEQELQTGLAGKQDVLIFDNVPVAGSSNPIKSGGVYTALNGKQDKLTFDNVPTAGSSNPVKSSGIFTAISDLAAVVDTKVPIIFDTITDQAIASFPDGMGNAAPKELTVPIVPIQDFNGYTKPWAGGAGKNLLDEATIELGAYNTTGGKTENGNAVYRRLSINLPAGTYTWSTTLADCYSPRALVDNVQIRGALQSQSDTFTLEDPANFKIVWRNTSSTEITEDFLTQIEVGSTATDYEPYENICPIVGKTGLTVYVSGKNLLNPSDIVQGGIGSSGGNATSAARVRSAFIPVLSGATYSVSVSSGYLVLAVHYYGEATIASWISRDTNSANTMTFTTPGDCSRIRILFSKNPNTEEITPSDFNENAQGQLGFGNVSAYVPYSAPQTYPVTWQTEAGEVYGGAIDAASGLLTVAWQNIASYAGETLPGKWVSSMDEYAAGESPTTGAQVVYELATPLTYQLTPPQISILYGHNNIWADIGNTGKLAYPADLKLYIDKKISELNA